MLKQSTQLKFAQKSTLLSTFLSKLFLSTFSVNFWGSNAYETFMYHNHRSNSAWSKKKQIIVSQYVFKDRLQIEKVRTTCGSETHIAVENICFNISSIPILICSIFKIWWTYESISVNAGCESLKVPLCQSYQGGNVTWQQAPGRSPNWWRYLVVLFYLQPQEKLKSKIEVNLIWHRAESRRQKIF